MNRFYDLCKQSLDALTAASWHVYAGEDCWSGEDLKIAAKFNLFSDLSIFYILSEEKARAEIRELMRDLLDVEDPESTIAFMIRIYYPTAKDIMNYFHRIPLSSGVLLEARKEYRIEEQLLFYFLSMEEVFCLAALTDEDSNMSVGLAPLACLALLECHENALIEAGIDTSGKADFQWPDFEMFAEIFSYDDFELPEFEPFGTEEIRKKAGKIYDLFAKGGPEVFRMIMRESYPPGFYRPYGEKEYKARKEAVLEAQYWVESPWRPPQKKEDTERIDLAVEELLSLASQAEEILWDKKHEGRPSRVTIAKKKHEEEYKKLMLESVFDFFLYLTASDEYVSGSEMRTINRCTGANLTKQDIERMIYRKNIYTVTFERTIPEILQRLKAADEWVGKQQENAQTFLSSTYVHYMEMAGLEFLKIDGSMNRDEERDLQTYLSNLKKFAVEASRDEL